MILDTTFVVDLLRGKYNAASKLKQLEAENVPYAISTPTIYELWSGLISLEKSEVEIQKTDSLIKEQIVYPLDEVSAEVAGKLDGKLIKKGTKIDPEDVMIAGIAIANNKKILTRDEHFSRIDGLKIEVY